MQTSPSSITLRWEVLDDGQSPVATTVISYKMTYGEWRSEEVGWHQTDHTLKNLSCGREYHMYVVLVNAMGSSPTSEVLTVRTQGSRPSAPKEEDFLIANATFILLKLDQWTDNNCHILYFVVEYRLHDSDTWTTGMVEFVERHVLRKPIDWQFSPLPIVINDLPPQAKYSIRGLLANTKYQLKITAHNHAGSTSKT